MIVQRLASTLIVLPFFNIFLHGVIKWLHDRAQCLLACFWSIAAETKREDKAAVRRNCNLTCEGDIAVRSFVKEPCHPFVRADVPPTIAKAHISAAHPLERR